MRAFCGSDSIPVRHHQCNRISKELNGRLRAEKGLVGA